MSEIWGIHSLTDRGPRRRFSTTWQRNGSFNGLYLWSKTW